MKMRKNQKVMIGVEVESEMVAAQTTTEKRKQKRNEKRKETKNDVF